jgi:hypothetical protein
MPIRHFNLFVANHYEQDKISKFWMYHITVNPHAPEAGSYGYWLVRNDPHLRSPAIGFHREPPAIQGAHAAAFQRRYDLARDFVGLVGRVMEFEIRYGTGRALPLPVISLA